MTTDAEYGEYLAQKGLEADRYTYTETLACTVAREMPDHCFAFVGTGLPLMAAGLAQRTHGPNITVILEAGIVGPRFGPSPVSVAEPRASLHAATLGTLVDAFGAIAAHGYCTLGVLGAAECDQYANLNASYIGTPRASQVARTPEKPGKITRLSGSGGANDIASLADRIIVMMLHEKRRFPPEVQYLTAPAGMRGPAGETRYDYGLFRGGDVVVITDLCIMRPNAETGILYASEIFPGVNPQVIKENTGWDIDLSRVEPMKMPTPEQIQILRMEVDPNRVYLGRKKK